MRSSSFHKLTADGGSFGYKLLVRMLYYPLNYINNRNADSNIDPELEILQFKISDKEKLKEQYSRLKKISSPSRKLSDLFWMNIDWDKLKKELGQINVCDIGCGSGNYHSRLSEASNYQIDTYQGIDINSNSNWEVLKSDSVSFSTYDGLNIFDKIPQKTNLIISQSAIEHFIEDLTIFKQINEFVSSKKEPIVLIHIFPTASCLKLYGYHGVRQYTPRNVSKITRLFDKNNLKLLYCLGDKNSNKTHLNYVSKGWAKKDLRKKYLNEYNQVCFDSIVNDFELQEIQSPNFYALIIKSKNIDEVVLSK